MKDEYLPNSHKHTSNFPLKATMQTHILLYPLRGEYIMNFYLLYVETF